MSNIQEIADKYLRLVAVFEDKNLLLNEILKTKK